MRRLIKKSSSVIILIMMSSLVYAAEIVTDLGSTSAGFSGGLDPEAYPGGSTTHTYVYDISGVNVGGGADTLEILVASTGTGGNIKNVGPGIVGANGNINWWEFGEDFSFDVKIKKAGVDVTSYYSVDLTGASLRWPEGMSASVSGTTVNGSGANTSFSTSALPTGETNETTFTAARIDTTADICQFSQLRLDITNSVPMLDYVDVVTDLGATSSGFTGGLDPESYPNGTSTNYTYVYDISNMGIDSAAVLELTVTSIGSGGNLANVGPGLVGKNGNVNWWEYGEDLGFDVKIRNANNANITDYYSVDLTGAALRWPEGMSASVSGTTINGSGTALSFSTSDLPTGEENETTFTAARIDATANICQFSQLRFTIANTAPVPNLSQIVADFGTDVQLVNQGFAGGISPVSRPGNTATNHTFVYDISGAGLTGAQTLEVDVTTRNAANLVGTVYGFSVDGGSSLNWWDVGEDVDFNIRVLDPADNDITALFTVDLTGASLRWGSGLSANVAGETIYGDGTDTTISTADLPEGETNQTSFVAERVAGTNICQFSQIRLVIGTTADFPEPFGALTEPANLLVNGDFSQATASGPGLNDTWRVTGSDGDYPAYDGYPYADVTGWIHYNEDPNGLASYTDSGEVLDGTDKIGCSINTNTGRIALNSSWDYRSGMVQTNALNGVTFNPTLTYVFEVDVCQNAAKDHSQTTFTAALTTGADATNTANVISGSIVQVSPTTSLPTTDGAPYSVQVKGSDLLAGPVNVMFESLNTENFTDGVTDWPAVGSVDPVAADEMSQLFVYNVSLTFIPGAGDVNRDGFVTQADVDLANLYLAGDGGDSAADRQAALIALGYSEVGALAYLNLGAFDMDGDGTFDAGDMAAIEELIPPPTVQVVLNGASVNLSWNSLPGKIYDVESAVSLSNPDWQSYASNTNIPSDISGTTSVNGVPMSGLIRFFRVIEKSE